MTEYIVITDLKQRKSKVSGSEVHLIINRRSQLMIKRIHSIGQKPKEDYIYKLMEFDINWLLLTSNSTEWSTSAELVFKHKMQISWELWIHMILFSNRKMIFNIKLSKSINFLWYLWHNALPMAFCATLVDGPLT